jgi:hypothetical protein
VNIWNGIKSLTTAKYLWRWHVSALHYSFAVLPSPTYLFTAGVEVVYFHLITLRHTPESVGLLWMRDRPVAETSTWPHKHCTCPPGGIRTRNLSKRSAADLRLRWRGHWDRPALYYKMEFTDQLTVNKNWKINSQINLCVLKEHAKFQYDICFHITLLFTNNTHIINDKENYTPTLM